MSTKAISEKFPRNLPCPCGSGRKYKHCCIDKDFELDDNGEILEVIEMSDDVAELLQQQVQAFVKKFGRQPGPGEPLMFDPESDTPAALNEAMVEKDMVEAMIAVGVRPELVYAFKKTGRLITEENQQRLSDFELQEWQDAIDEYFDLNDDDLKQ